MKTIKTLSFVLLLISFLSCGNEKEEIPAAPDYSQLGIEQITIGSKTFYTKSGSLLLDTGNGNQIVLTRTSSGTLTPELIYTCVAQAGEVPSVSVKSKYNETSIVIAESLANGIKTFTVTVKKDQCQIEAKYIFYFINV